MNADRERVLARWRFTLLWRLYWTSYIFEERIHPVIPDLQ